MPSTIFQTPGFGPPGATSQTPSQTQGRNYNAPGFDNPYLQNAMNALLSQQLMQLYGVPPQQAPPAATPGPSPQARSQMQPASTPSPASQAVMQAIKGPSTQGGGGQQQLRK